MRYYAESVTNKGYSAELTFSKEDGRRFLKMMGLETITRKRFKKLLMGCGIQKNEAEIIAREFQNERNKIHTISSAKSI